jgi:hypothetical protein
MGWAKRVSRRRVLVGILVVVVLVDAALGLAFLATDSGTAARAPFAPPLHPVAGSFVPDGTRLLECGDDPCFQQAFGNIAFREGPQAAFALVGKVYGDGSGTACHRVVHTIGAAALARYHGNVSRTFADGSSICWSGYYHGVLERALLNVTSYRPAALGRVAGGLCRDAVEHMTPWIAYQCLHGLGHGLMITTGLQLPLALDVCRQLARRWDRDACKGGVFMENIQSSYGFRSRWLRDDDPLYPCESVARADKSRCYQMATSRVMPSVHDDWERTAAICSRVEAGFAYACFRSFGRDASSRTGRDPAETARLCSIARSFGGERDCVVAAAMDVVSNYVDASRATALCEAVDSDVEADCYFGIGAVLGRFRRTDGARERDCRALVDGPALVSACLRGGKSALPRA